MLYILIYKVYLWLSTIRINSSDLFLLMLGWRENSNYAGMRRFMLIEGGGFGHYRAIEQFFDFGGFNRLFF